MAFILLLISMVVDIIVRERNFRRYTKIKQRYFEKLKEVCYTTTENLSEEEIRRRLGYRERRWKKWEMLLWARIFTEVSLYTNTQNPNLTNLQKIMTFIGFHDFVERALIHGRRKIKVRYMEVVVLTNMQLPNSIVTRMVNDKYEPLRKSARIYYMLTTKDNPNVFFEEEGSVAGNFSIWDKMEMHGVLNKMQQSGRNMPKFVPVIQNLDNGNNRSFVAFMMREIAYWSTDKELKFLFRYFDSSDLMFRQAAFTSMGQRRFLDAEDVMKNIYYRQPETLQRVVLEAVFAIRSGRSVSFFAEAFKHSVSEYTRREALRCLWLYGDNGRATFFGLKEKANEETKILFEHVESPLINNYSV